MSERQELVGAYWRFNLAQRRAEYVRRNDGLVLDSRAMTLEEVQREMLKEGTKRLARGEKPLLTAGQAQQALRPAAKQQPPARAEKPIGGQMRGKTRERVEALIGQEFNRLTILEIVGQNPKTGSVLVKAECQCGDVLESAMVADITSGRKWRCGLSCTAKGDRPDRVKNQSQLQKAKGRMRSNQRATVAVPALAQSSAGGKWRKELMREAETLRRAAVGILTGRTSKEELVEALRRQADRLDDLIYAEQEG